MSKKEISHISLYLVLVYRKDGKIVYNQKWLLEDLVNCKFWIQNGKLHLEELSSNYLNAEELEIDNISICFNSSSVLELFEGELGCIFFEAYELIFTKEYC